MKIEMLGNTIRISAVKQLGVANANRFHDWVRKALADDTRNIEIDLSQMTYLGSSGLGALVTLRAWQTTRLDLNGRNKRPFPIPPVSGDEAYSLSKR